MHLSTWRHCILSLGLLLTLSASAQGMVYAADERSQQRLNDHALILDAAPLDWGLDEVMAAFAEGAFIPANGRASATDPLQATWIRLELQRQQGVRDDWMLLTHAVSQRELTAYLQTEDGWRTVRSGNRVPFAEGRDKPFRHPSFALSLQAETTTVVYLRYFDPVGSIFPLSLITPEALDQKNLHQHIGFGLIFGIIIGLLLYNVSLMVHLRDRVYGWYVLSLAAVLLLVLDGTNFGVQYLTPEISQPRWMDRTSAGALWGFALAILSQQLLATRAHSPRLHRLISLLALTFAAAWIAHQLHWDQLSTQVSRILALVGIVLLVLVAVRRWLQGSRIALYFLAGHGIVLMAALIMAGRNLGLVDPHSVNTYWFPAAVAFECIVFSLALAYRIQTLQREREKAISDAQRDPLTGLLNRRGLDAAFRAFRKRQQGEIGLILLDLNKFKAVNDTHGHDVGDLLLQSVANGLRRLARDGDAIARLGGDEFALLFHHNQSADLLTEMTQRIDATFRTPADCNGLPLTIHTSVGTATAPATEAEYDELFRRADQNLYAAKRKTTKYTPAESVRTLPASAAPRPR